MFESNVRLLSDYAERYVRKADNVYNPGGFWGELLSAFSEKSRDYEIYGTDLEEASEEDLIAEGYAPFCEIHGRRIFFRKTSELCMVAIRCNDQLWDLDEWGEGEEFIIRLIAECYFMVTRDDFKIDEDEAKVLRALIGYLEPTCDELVEARNMVYWTLVENVIEDDHVSEEENELLESIRRALEIRAEDVHELHTSALRGKLQQLKNESEDSRQLDLVKLDSLKKMAEKLGVNPDIFDQ
ncbi:MAG: hypothetical protein Kow0029_02190 [Candidatus Rifleibacteriota bacterium]